MSVNPINEAAPAVVGAGDATTTTAADTESPSVAENDFEEYVLVKPKSKKSPVELHQLSGPPELGTYQFYVENLCMMQLGSPECEAFMAEKMQNPKVKWIATHKAGFDYLTKKGATQSKAEKGEEMWMIHHAKEYKHKFQHVAKSIDHSATAFAAGGDGEQPSTAPLAVEQDPAMKQAMSNNQRRAANRAKDEELKAAGKKRQLPGITGNEYFFIGRKIECDADDALCLLVVTVDELWLKSAYHQKAMYKNLISDMSRVLPRSYVTKAGNGLLHIRVAMPTEEELDLCSLIPGINQIGLPSTENLQCLGKILKVGPGGVPLLHDQRALCLMSGGIDSPVAAYKTMSRGTYVDGVHFLNSTSDTAAVIEKNRKLCARLSQIQGTFTMKFVDINELQMAIVGVIPNNNRTLVYKWFMLHLSSIMDIENKILVTGDSLGQVASQTLCNLASLYPGLRKPVLPPLIGSNKRDIMTEAKKIGTYDLSIVQAADCCQFMMRKTLANLTIDTWTLYGEIAKVLRHTMPEFLPVSVDTFKNGKLVSTHNEKFPFAQNAPLLFEVIDAKGRLGLNPMIGYRHNREGADGQSADGSDDATQSAGGKKEDDDTLAKKYFGVEAPAISVPVVDSDDSGADSADKATGKLNRAQRLLVTQGTVHAKQAKVGLKAGLAAKKQTFHFDSAAGTSICREALDAMLGAPGGNPNALHASGRAARVAIEKVRAQVAAMIGKPASNVIFTSGGTESNGIALHGFKVEREEWSHSSTKANEASLHSAGVPVTLVKVVDLVHHETGSIASQEMLKRPANGGRLHLDACQALGKIQFKNFDLSEVDTMTLNSHKIHGPHGVGALYVKDISSLKSLWVGGAQEYGLRPGTENVPGIVGFGAALKAAEEHLLQEQEDYQERNINKVSSHAHGSKKAVAVAIPPHRYAIQEFLTKKLESLGCEVNKRGETIGYIVHATLPANLKLENADIVNALSTQYKVEIGTGSACNSKFENTTTYETLGVSPIPKKRSIRLSFDRYTTMDDAEHVADALATVIGQNKK